MTIFQCSGGIKWRQGCHVECRYLMGKSLVSFFRTWFCVSNKTGWGKGVGVERSRAGPKWVDDHCVNPWVSESEERFNRVKRKGKIWKGSEVLDWKEDWIWGLQDWKLDKGWTDRRQPEINSQTKATYSILSTLSTLWGKTLNPIDIKLCQFLAYQSWMLNLHTPNTFARVYTYVAYINTHIHTHIDLYCLISI